MLKVRIFVNMGFKPKIITKKIYAEYIRGLFKTVENSVENVYNFALNPLFLPVF